MKIRCRVVMLLHFLLVILALFVVIAPNGTCAGAGDIKDWKELMEDYVDTDGDGEKDDFKSFQPGNSFRLIDFLSEVTVYEALGITEMTMASCPNQTAIFGNTIDEEWEESMVFLDVEIISMDETDGDPGEYYLIYKVSLYHAETSDDDGDQLLDVESIPTTLTGQIVLVVLWTIIIILVLIYLSYYFLVLKKRRRETTFEAYLPGVQTPIKNQYSSSIIDRFRTVIAPVFQEKGYAQRISSQKPFNSVKRTTAEMKELEFYNIHLRKGVSIGTRTILTWEGNKLDKFVLRTREDTRLFRILAIVFSLIFSIICYGMTAIFFDYWILVIFSLICPPIFLFMAFLPLLLGAAIGISIASLVYAVVLPGKARKINRSDGLDIFKVLKEFSEVEVKKYNEIKPDMFTIKMDVSWH